MARKKKSVRRKKRVSWTPADLKLMRQHAGKKPLLQIARLLKRSAAAVRFKASMHRISLRQRKG
jgi:hypothetical protein